MMVAGLVGLLQMFVLGSATRSVRLLALLVAVGAGAYGIGMAAIALEFAITRAVSWLTSYSLRDVVGVSTYVVAPLVEEPVKLIPLWVAVRWAKTGRQWGFTDHVLVGGAVGVGFGLLEAMMRYGLRGDRALDYVAGWALSPSLVVPFTPTPAVSLQTWLPAPVSPVQVGTLPVEPGTFYHLAWSAVAAFGIAVLVRGARRWRWLGFAPILLSIGDHGAVNYDASPLYQSDQLGWVFAPFLALSDWLWVWPLLVLLAAAVLDHRTLVAQRRLRPELLIPGEADTGVFRLIAFGLIRPPVTTLISTRFALFRRAALYAAALGPSRQSDELLTEVGSARDQLVSLSDPSTWERIRAWQVIRLGVGPNSRRLLWFTVAWMLVVAPGVAFYGWESTPRSSATGAADETSTWVVAVLLLSAVAAAAWISLGAWSAARRLPLACSLPDGSMAAALQFRLFTAAGAAVLLAGSLVVAAGGSGPDDPVVSNFFGLDAITALLLIGGIALIVVAVVFFPPSAVVLAGGLAVGGVVLTPGFVVFGGLGVAAITLATQRSIAISSGDVEPVGFSEPPRKWPWGEIGFAAAASVGISSLLDHLLGPDAAPEPIDPHHYIDPDGKRRWKDTNQLVELFPNRTQSQDEEGVWRWDDTRQPVREAAEGSLSSESGSSPVFGFDTVAEFMDFGDALHREFADEGIDDAEFYLQGSAVTNLRHESGEPFDAGESDFDVLVVSDQLAARLRESGFEFRSDGRSRPIDRDQVAGLVEMESLRRMVMRHAGRDVSFQIVSSSDLGGLEGGRGVYIPSRQG